MFQLGLLVSIPATSHSIHLSLPFIPIYKMTRCKRGNVFVMQIKELSCSFHPNPLTTEHVRVFPPTPKMFLSFATHGVIMNLMIISVYGWHGSEYIRSESLKMKALITMYNSCILHNKKSKERRRMMTIIKSSNSLL